MHVCADKARERGNFGGPLGRGMNQRIFSPFNSLLSWGLRNLSVPRCNHPSGLPRSLLDASKRLWVAAFLATPPLPLVPSKSFHAPLGPVKLFFLPRERHGAMQRSASPSASYTKSGKKKCVKRLP